MITKLKYILLLFIITFTFGCNNSENNNSSNEEISSDVVNNPLSANGKNNTGTLPKFQFSETNHDFGVIIQGEKVSYTYRFINAGGSDLLIASATASCGCTVANYDKNPIKPGKEGKIEIVFDSNSKIGIQHKAVSILANTQPNQVTLNFTAEVIIPK